MADIQSLRDLINDYESTIWAMLGFANFYRYDDDRRQMRSDIVVFQGRRLTRSSGMGSGMGEATAEDVTPDIGVLLPNARGVLGEVKRSFPRDKAHRHEDFEQLASYDDDLTGWPCETGRVSSHDIALLVHLTRVRAVCDFFVRGREDGTLTFARPFAMLSFNQSEEGRSYLFFRKEEGRLSDVSLNDRLRLGVDVPMNEFLDEYSKIKLCDCEPPVPYMAWLIWDHVIAPRASEAPSFPALRRNQKVEVTLRLDEIVAELRTGFSSHILCPNLTERQPQVPRKEWCRRALDALADAGEAQWVDPTGKEEIRIYFRKFKPTIERMLEICGAQMEEDRQLSLFSDTAAESLPRE